ncbi:thioredoxin fold domain-containing protein, partial [bacterium]|nr:thioredoxin fold domain-containing protein [bacterium]
DLVEVFTKLCRKFGIKRNVELCYLDSNRINSPLVIGYLKPKVFLPRRIAETWKVKDIEPVLTHELAHIKRHDIIINWLQILIQVVFFFHPVVWFTNWKIRNLREDACDDLAIEQIKTSRKRYVEKMLRIIKESVHEPAFTFQVTGFIETRSSLAKRIIRILSTKYRAHPRLTAVSVLSLIFVAVVSIALCSGRTVNSKKIIEIETPVKFGKSHNINFVEAKTLEEIVNILKKENKPGFLYFSLQNEEWCTKLEKEVFSIDSISSYIETNFISFNLNYYRSDKELREKFRFQGYPSAVIINKSGEEMGRIYGYSPAEEYFGYLRKAFEEGKNTMQMKAAYEANPDNIYTAYEYAARLFNYKKYEEALPIWEVLNKKTFEKDFQNVWKFLHLGRCYEMTKQTDKAIEVYKKALEPGGITSANRKFDTCRRLIG